MPSEANVRSHLVKLLRGEGAHMSLAEAAADFPMAEINTVIPSGVYTSWHLLEHIRLAQRDILDFMTNPDYVAPEWPAGYWPARGTQATPEQWEHTLSEFAEDNRELQKLAEDPDFDLDEKIDWGDGQTRFREFLIVADHNAYHTGEFAILRQAMGTWPAGHQG